MKLHFSALEQMFSLCSCTCPILYGPGFSIAAFKNVEYAAAVLELLKSNFAQSRTKNQPKEEVFGTDISRTSGGHSRISRPKTSVRAVKSWNNKHFGTDIHEPKARTSTLRDIQKLRSEKLWAEFSFPTGGGYASSFDFSPCLS